MKKLLRILPMAALALLLSSVLVDTTVAQSHAGHTEHAGKQDDVVHPKLIDGVQVVEIGVSKTGFSAKKIALKAGVPARLVFTRTEDGGCAYQVQIPDFKIEATDLPLNKPVAITFMPQESGQYTFACGMDMVKGALLVKSAG